MPITSKANAAPAETVQSKNARREAEIALAMKQEAERRAAAVKICIASARYVCHAPTEKLQRPGNEGPEEVHSEEAHSMGCVPSQRFASGVPWGRVRAR
jgi:hypothetical protein